MTRIIFPISFLVLTLAGCAGKQENYCPAPVTRNVPYEVKVPVYVKPVPPSELTRPYKPTEYPVFVEPADPQAKYGLTELDWQRLQVILRTMGTRDQAWRNWAKKFTGAPSK